MPLGLTIIGRLLLVPFQTAFPLADNIATEILYDIAVLAASVVFVRWSVTWGVPQMMSLVRDIAANTQEPRRDFLRRLATTQVRETERIIDGLTGAGYRVHRPAAMRPWFERFFADGGGRYVGVDSHRPAEYMAQYGWYLEVHGAYLEAQEGPSENLRIITTPRKELSDDYRQGHADYQKFDRWHQDHDVTVKWRDPTVVQQLRDRYGIGQADVSLWDNFAVLFSTDPGGAVTLRMWFPGEPEKDGTTFEKISEYVKGVARNAKDLGEVVPRLELVDRELASVWESYVDPYAREQGGVGPFLKTVLGDRSYVFDAAAGIGSDSVYLIKEGFQVFSNEVDSLLSDQARDYARRQGVELQLTPYLWETLPASLPGGMRFDAVLCLGNSLCLVEDEAGRRRCLRALAETLLPDGLLLIDERNFESIIRHAKEINADPIEWFPPTTKGDLMYRGLSVRGYPAEVLPREREIKWRFFRNSPTVHSVEEINEQRLHSADLNLYAFECGELYDLIQSVGLQVEGVYADMQLAPKSETGMPPFEDIMNSEFITYVARKTRATSNSGLVSENEQLAHQGPGA